MTGIMKSRIKEYKYSAFPGWDGPTRRTEGRLRRGSDCQLETGDFISLNTRGCKSLGVTPSGSHTSLSSYHTARKDVDYKISEAGDSLTCVTNAAEGDGRRCERGDVADTDMPYDVQEYALGVVKDAVRAYRMSREVARHIKRAMDGKFGLCWQCHVGKEFGLRVSYIPGSYMFITVESQAVILYRSM